MARSRPESNSRRALSSLLERSRAGGETFRTSEALAAGVHPRDLYALRDSGELDQLSRGLFRASAGAPLADPDLVTVARRVPRAVVCLTSALHLHGLTDEVPRSVSIALPAGTHRPALDWPPVTVYRFSGRMFTTGIEERSIDGTPVRVYGAAKSVADAFRFRHRLGLELGLEALKRGLAERRFTPGEILDMARLCRVGDVVRPYVESLV